MKHINIIILLVLCSPLFAQNQFNISDGNVKIISNVQIVLKDAKWINNGTFSATDGTVLMTGSATQANSSIGGTSETIFHNLTINKSSNNAELNQNISVENTVTLTNGNLELNDNNILLNGTFTLNNGHYFQTSGTGTFKQTISNNETKTFPVGNETDTPMTIKNDGTADVFSVRCTPEVLENGTSGNALTTNVVDRTWFVKEAVSGGNALFLTATWNADDELSGFDRTQTYLSNYSSGWISPMPSAATGSNPYAISKNNISPPGIFAVASNGALLPKIGVDISNPSLSENANNIFTFTFTRTENTEAALTIYWSVGGENITNSDYSVQTGGTGNVTFDSVNELWTITFPANESTVDLNIQIHEDSLVEGNEELVVTLKAPPNP